MKKLLVTMIVALLMGGCTTPVWLKPDPAYRGPSLFEQLEEHGEREKRKQEIQRAFDDNNPFN